MLSQLFTFMASTRLDDETMTIWQKRQTFLDISFPTLIAICCSLPLIGLLVCEVWCVFFAFHDCNSTICAQRPQVWNFLPSVSVATGQFPPQKYIWRLAIALHTTPRFVIAAGYHNMHRQMFSRSSAQIKYRRLSTVVFILHVSEILALAGLSFIPSAEDYETHKFCFCTFMFCAILHMIFMVVLHRRWKFGIYSGISVKEEMSLRCKQVLLLVNATFFAAALYFFFRHNTYCEDGVYSLFAICEIIVVVSNIGFHGTAVIDFDMSVLRLQDIPDG